MATGTVGIGRQDFEKIRVHNNFYVDKTDFIRQWWEADDDVTLITRQGRGSFGEEPERFYHGFVLGLMVDLADKYAIASNRESGFDRYDIMLEPRNVSGIVSKTGDAGTARPVRNSEIKWDAIIIEFKVQDTEEKELADSVPAALRQIEERNYQAGLVAKGIPEEHIRKYGFAFCGKRVLIGVKRDGE